MRRTRRRVHRLPSSGVLDGCFFAFSTVAAVWFAYVLLRDGLEPGGATLLLLVFWVFFSYLVLPRLHGILTAIYLPGYFVGRARTSDGLLGDPVNLGLRGREAQIHAAMTAAGWTRADELDARTAAAIVGSVLRRRSYAGAPVSPLHLFDRPQDFTYEQEVAGSPSRRHHIRFWRCPDDWLLPGGFQVDWIAAATFDRGVGLSLFTLQITHRIAEDTDAERDFVVDSVCAALPAAKVTVIEHFSSGYHARNGGGDRIGTDGALPILDLRGTDAPPDPEPAPVRARRPQGVLLGAGVALARAPAYVVSAVATGAGGTDPRLVAWFAVAAVVDAVLALGVLAGHNSARLLLMAACTFTAVAAMSAAFLGAERPVGVRQLLSVGGSILVVLALSGRDAREYATGGRTRAARVAAAR